jgi:hypothetical protein
LISAGVAQLVERLLPKQKVTGSNPVTRFTYSQIKNPLVESGFLIPNAPDDSKDYRLMLQ